MPGAGDDVTICPGFTVTLNTSPLAPGLGSLTVDGILRFDGTARNLRVAGNILINSTGQLIVQNLTATHTLTLGGNITNNGTLNLAVDGNSICNATFNGAGPQIIGGTSAAATRFNNVTVTNSLTVNKSGAAVTQVGTLTVGGALLVQAGTLSVANTVAVTGLTTVGGTLTNTSATGTKTFTGGMTINLGGTFSNNTVVEPVTIGGNLTNNGTFTSGTGLYTFNSAGNWAGTNPIAFGGGVTVTAARTNNATVSVTGTLAITGAVTLTNNATVTAAGAITGSVAGSTWTNATNSTLNVTGALLATGTLNASASGNTIDFRSAANQTIKQASSNQYFNLTFSNGGTDSFPTAGSTQNILGSLTINAGATLSANTNDNIINVTGNMVVNGTYLASNVAGRTLTVTGDLSIGGTFTGNTAPVTLRGNFTRTGTFTSGIGLFTFNGTALQTLTGASTFTNVTVNNAAGLSLANDMTMTTAAAGTLTLTSGNITTGANILIVPRPCNVVGVSRTSGHVVGNLRKAIPAGASTCTYEIGSGSNYTPAVLTFVAGTGAGNITASTTGTVHPQSGDVSSGIDLIKRLNRYWTLTNNTVTLPVAGYSATLNFINGTPVDIAAGVAANFIVERWNGAAWTSTTLNASCTATPVANLCKRVDGLTAAAGFGDFWMGEAKVVVPPPPDSFNAVEVSANAVSGKIFTKLRSANFTLDIVAIRLGVQYATFSEAVDADLIANAAAGTCAGGTPIGSTSQSVNLVTGRGTSGAYNVATAYPNVRVRIRYPTGGPYTITTCSSDNFSIKPTAFNITSTDATNLTTGGTTVFKTGATFNLTAAGGAGYTGTPGTNFSGNVTGTPTAGTLGAVGAGFLAADGSGTASGTFFYGEVGHFGLLVDAVRDTSFTAVDPAGTDCVASSTSDTLSGGQYGCWIGSSPVAAVTGLGFGRFIPDNFNVSYNVPVIAPSCTGFSYVGQVFNYSTPPVMTVTARNGTNNGLTNATTVNYAGSYMKFANDNTSLAQAAYDTQLERYTRFDALGGGNTPALDPALLPATSADPAIGAFASGVGSLTFSGGGGFSFTRSSTTPSAPFDADIALALNVIDGDGVTFAGNPASFGAATAGNGMLFSDGNAGTTNDKRVRYGRLYLGNVSGSQVLPLRVPVEAQYWNGTAFIANTLDSCTTLAAGNIGLGNYVGNLGAGETTASIVNSPLQGGRSAVQLSAPGVGNQGSVDVALNLGSGAAADACAGFAPAATAGNLAHLRGRWCNPPGSYSKDPSARARFGVSRGSDQTIYRREQ